RTRDAAALPARASPVTALLFLAYVDNAPDRVRSVVGDKQRSIGPDGHAHRTPPHLAVLGDEAGEEVLIAAERFAVLHRNANHLVARTNRLVPGPVLAREDVAAILLRELMPFVEHHLERGIMRLQQHIGNNHSIFQLRVLA